MCVIYFISLFSGNSLLKKIISEVECRGPESCQLPAGQVTLHSILVSPAREAAKNAPNPSSMQGCPGAACKGLTDISSVKLQSKASPDY